MNFSMIIITPWPTLNWNRITCKGPVYASNLCFFLNFFVLNWNIFFRSVFFSIPWVKTCPFGSVLWTVKTLYGCCLFPCHWNVNRNSYDHQTQVRLSLTLPFLSSFHILLFHRTICENFINWDTCIFVSTSCVDIMYLLNVLVRINIAL